MKSREKAYSSKSSKKKSSTSFRFICFIIILIAIPVLYGLYLCKPEFYNAYSQTKTTTPFQPIPYTTDLDIPLLTSKQPEQVIRHKGYTVSYNKEWKLPNWVSYELTPQETTGEEKRNNRFVADPQVKGAMAANSDYAHSGFDKGHMAPAADMKWNKAAMKESFYFSNICPQHPELNRRKWKDLEEKVREWAQNEGNAIIVSGPIVENSHKTIGRNRVVIPQKFYKVILLPYAKSPRAIGFIFDNKSSSAPLKSHAVTVDSVEIITKIDFFSSLPDNIEDTIEAHINTSIWGI